MFEKLVVGLDGLDGGADALVLARILAAKDTELTLLHAYPVERRPSRAAELDYDAVLRRDALKLLEGAAPQDRHVKLLPVRDLSPARALHAAAEREGADLIVIGSSHRGAIGRVLAGDVCRATLHGSPCPVAVAPRGYRWHAHPPKAVGVAEKAPSHA